MSKSEVVPVLDKLFNILHLINDSEIPLTAQDVSDITGYNKRTALRYLSRLAQERFIGFRVQNYKKKYGYKYKEDGSIIDIHRNSCGYEYYRLGGIDE